MFFQKNKEQDLERQTQLLKELIIRSEALDKEIKDLFDEIANPEYSQEFISDPSNFTPENWEELQKQRQQMMDKLDQELQNIQNPEKTKKAYAERNVDPRWLFVR